MSTIYTSQNICLFTDTIEELLESIVLNMVAPWLGYTYPDNILIHPTASDIYWRYGVETQNLDLLC
jgi:hypothetical protein